MIVICKQFLQSNDFLLIFSAGLIPVEKKHLKVNLNTIQLWPERSCWKIMLDHIILHIRYILRSLCLKSKSKVSFIFRIFYATSVSSLKAATKKALKILLYEIELSYPFQIYKKSVFCSLKSQRLCILSFAINTI